jgi:hypothetical protein
VSNLWQWLNEAQQNAKINPQFLDNTLMMLRSITQSTGFIFLLQEPSAFKNSLLGNIVSFLRYCDSVLHDLNFIVTGPDYRLKSAIHYCVIVQRLSQALCHDPLSARDGLSSGLPPPRSTSSSSSNVLDWNPASRRACLNHFKEWYSVILEVSATKFTTSNLENERIRNHRFRLLRMIGYATEQLLEIPGTMFDNGPMPQEIIVWLAQMEGSGYYVFKPNLLINSDSILGTVLVYSYRYVRRSYLSYSLVDQKHHNH